MRVLLLLLFLGHLVRSVHAQPEERYAIGFADTLLFTDSLHYAGFGYDGPAPLFVQAWFPMDHGAKGATLTHAQLCARRLNAPLQRVYQELLLRQDSAFFEYDLRYPFGGAEPISYAPYTEQQVKDSLFALPTLAYRAALPKAGQRPVVVYHHGSQGMSDENAAMAEYLARQGFIFLSCNFHWPLEDAPYGTPLVWEPDRGSVHTLLRFARQLAGHNKVFYIGHSWGAHEGWCTLYQPGLADAFVSLETTMEWKTDTAEVRDKWPHMLEAMTTHQYPMPILMVADTEGKPPFPLFTGVRGDLRYLDPKQAFGHESYTSAYLLRGLDERRFHVPDATSLREQQIIYHALLEEILAFLQEQAGKKVRRPVYDGEDPFERAGKWR